MFKKILIANRGEIALRIIRACKELGIKTVAVYAEPDFDSLHVRFADEDICIGPGESSQSYLNIAHIISAAEVSDAEAIHPGYGFLAEDPHFAEICEECNIKFIGPKPDAIRLMGDKSRAKDTMREAGVPVVPGSDGVVETLTEAQKEARHCGYPVMIKAAAGGGGRGMRIVNSTAELLEAFPMAQNEAEKAFGRADLYLEKYIESPKHIEFQILADEYGNIVHLGERDCSIQRRHQKLIEETPCSIMDEELRETMGRAAVKAAEAVNYTSAGTVEFLLDREGNFYFMEMNTRIQVEHPITEEVTRIDIVKEQIKIAAGEQLSLRQKDVKLMGHSIECRINAEDPEQDFLPTPGKITAVHIPGGPGIRMDTHIYAEYVVPPYYDSLLGKLIVWGRNREEAIQRMNRALTELVIEGVKTTIPFHLQVINSDIFREGIFGTDFIEKYLNIKANV
ncbi:acetyl-CoA carboxylase biotin carboxylase subunit [Candidatus Sumerlaeota bacterium]|nr:acetyl-CoA carboxylase biotin carboxylase subunit [Candidatus Sumerlaeota bacterium]